MNKIMNKIIICIVSLVFISLFMVLPASAVYLPVENGTNIQASRSGSFVYDYDNSMTLLYNLTNVSINSFGMLRFQFICGNEYVLPLKAYCRIYKNEQPFGIEFNASGTSNIDYNVTEYIIGYINTSDVISVYGARVRSNWSELSYNYTAAPVIISHANNSAQTSRALNVNYTYTGTGSVLGEFSTASDFSTKICSQLTTSGWNNCTIPTGLIYVRLQGNDTANNSETNWSPSYQFNVYDVAHSGWNPNGLKENVSKIEDTNIIIGNSLYRNEFLTCDNLRFSVSTAASCQDGLLWLNRSNGVSAIVNTTYFPDGWLISKVKFWYGSSAATMTMGHFSRVNNPSDSDITNRTYIYIYNGTTASAMREYYTSGNTLFQAGALYFSSQNDWMYYNTKVYGNTYYRTRVWNTTVSIPDWDGTFTNDSYLGLFNTGRIGLQMNGLNNSADYLWLKPVFDDGTMVLSSNYTLNDTTDYWHISGKNNTRPFAISVYWTGTDTTNISIQVNTSINNVSWSGWTTIATNAVSNDSYPLPLENQRYIHRRYFLQGNETESPQILSDQIYSKNISYIEGYIKYTNGTLASGATYGYYNNWSLTSDGFYNISDFPLGNRTLAVGQDGFNASGDILNITSNTYLLNQNYTIGVATVSPQASSEFVNQTYLSMLSMINSTCEGEHGCIQDNGVPNDNFRPEGAMRVNIALSGYYNLGINRTPQYYERILSIFNYQKEQVNNITITDFTEIWRMRVYDNMYNHLTKNTRDFFNTSINSFDTNIYQISFNDSDFGTQNHLYHYMLAEQIKEFYGLNHNQTMIDNIVNRTIERYSGYDNKSMLLGGEASVTPSYAMLALGYLDEMTRFGYVPSSEYQAIVNNGKENMKMLVLQDGSLLYSGRLGGSLSSLAVLARDAALFQDGEFLRLLDITYQKSLLYWNVTGDNTFQAHLNFNLTNPSWAYQTGTNGMYFYNAAQYHDRSIIETPLNKSLLDAFNTTSSLIKTDIGNYSIYMFALSSGSTCDEVTSYVTPAMRFYLTYKDSEQQTFSYFPGTSNSVKTNSVCRYAGSYPTFNNASKIINISKVTSNLTRSVYTDIYPNMLEISEIQPNRNNISYGLDTFNGMWMNWTNQYFLDGTSLGYFNISVSNLSDDKLHIQYKFNRSGLDNFSIPLVFLTYDYLNNASIDITNNNFSSIFNYSLGKQTVNLTNFTGQGIANLNLTYTTTDYELGSFGYNNYTYLDGDLVGDWEIILGFDTEISTTNTYGFLLNQPPGVWSYSPETPLTIGLSSQTFNFEGTQNLDTIKWEINGTIKEWDNDTSVGSYTNSTAGSGTYNVTATGCNVQGCASFSWLWTVDGDAPASVTNATATSNYTHVLMSWSNPLDADFSYTYWLNGSTWMGNFTNISWNISGTAGQTFNYSVQTVDSLGNVNLTLVWFNSSILIESYNTTPSISNINNNIDAHYFNISFDVNQSNALTATCKGLTNSLELGCSTEKTTGLNRYDNVTGLNNNTLYYYGIYAINLSNNTLISWYNNSFTTDEDYIIPDTNTTPSISNINNNIDAHYFNISFNVNQSNALTATCKGLTSNLELGCSTEKITGLNRYDNVTGLNNNTLYYYGIYAINLSNNTLISWYNNSFTTDEDYIIPDSQNPNITNWGNNFTNSSSLSFTIEMNTNVLFNFSSNQTLTNFYWIGIDTSNNYNASKNFTVSGNKVVSVYGSNENGSTQQLTWNINVNNTYPLSADIYFSEKNILYAINSNSNIVAFKVIMLNNITSEIFVTDTKLIYSCGKNLYVVDRYSGQFINIYKGFNKIDYIGELLS